MLESLIYLPYFLMLLILMLLILHPNLSIIQSMMFLLTFTISTCISISLHFTLSLYSFLIFLMIIGGLMILFMMFLSLISNQYNHSKWKKLLLPLTIILIIFIILLNKFSLINLNPIPNLSIKDPSINFYFMNLNQMMEFPFNIFIILLMFLLLFFLILITKICIINSKPLRMIKK
uniref:NADH dehydrogenase subunit 6 n=2 Tax=Vespa velutina TaxID=202808 RepID=A0A347YEK0_VESVE|nr:NADH dehydrogenase subunit 6 [Vespa velutina]AQT19237.1 NADH dehydrogenase subunit 6 [Vespa velutina nigrithorax]BAX73960.2 NADH dehydrogenase subunit 6 [Vespa velutina]BBC27618.1 NADH dehydrogenase subunit 6 [Vespa velutina]BBC27631.1 NADH dehydrogenase subunit 6 [Vespa velutina]BBC44292.1 NADH dehydrogenase subunit 6 [Vespa velutina]